MRIFYQEYIMTEYLRMSGIYWGLCVMDLMSALEQMNRKEVLAFVQSCHHENGGFSASVGHDPHLLYTLSAVQVSKYQHVIIFMLPACVLYRRTFICMMCFADISAL